MKDPTQLTGAEWLVMEALWAGAPKTVTELARHLQGSAGWAKSTSLTMVRRMEAKGLIRHEEGGRAKLYYPCLDRENAAMQETRHFLGRVYRGSVGLMMSALLERQQLSRQEIDELYALLQKAEEAKPDDR